MKLSMDMATRDVAGFRPWHDQPRGKGRADNEGRFDRYGEARFDAPVEELHRALADGEWHPKEIAREIAKRHRVGLIPMLDHAGVYFEGEECIWALKAQRDA